MNTDEKVEKFIYVWLDISAIKGQFAGKAEFDGMAGMAGWRKWRGMNRWIKKLIEEAEPVNMLRISMWGPAASSPHTAMVAYFLFLFLFLLTIAVVI